MGHQDSPVGRGTTQVPATTTQASGTGQALLTEPQNWDWQTVRLLSTGGRMAQVCGGQQGDPTSFRAALGGLPVEGTRPRPHPPGGRTEHPGALAQSGSELFAERRCSSSKPAGFGVLFYLFFWRGPRGNSARRRRTGRCEPFSDGAPVRAIFRRAPGLRGPRKLPAVLGAEA